MGDKEVKISKEDVITIFLKQTGNLPTWYNKKFTELEKEERSQYQKYRKILEKQLDGEAKGKVPLVEPEVQQLTDEDPMSDEDMTDAIEELPDKAMALGVGEDELNEPQENKEVAEDISVQEVNKLLVKKGIPVAAEEPEEDVDLDEVGYYEHNGEMSNEEKVNLINHTTQKMAEDILTPEEKEILENQRIQDQFIDKYLDNHQIKNQEHLNYAIEHDMKFREYLEKTDRLKGLYRGRHLEEIKLEKEKVEKQLEKEAKKDKRHRVIKRFQRKKKKVISNDMKDATKSLDLTAYRNKKLESQGFMLCVYLRKNGLMDIKYVKMDEVGQIKVDGYVYHERDATYRFGKKNDPVLLIMEGSLVPLNKETLKENLGFQSAEAQKLIIKGIEQAEVVKAGGADDNLKKPFTPPKWIILIGIGVIIAIYAYMGGFS